MPRGRRPSTKKRIHKYEKDFLKVMKSKHQKGYTNRLEDSDIETWPGNTRYTVEFKNKQKETINRMYGNKKVTKYRPEFLVFLEENFNAEGDYLDNLENRCNRLINREFPGQSRYTDEYINENKKSSTRVKNFRSKNLKTDSTVQMSVSTAVDSVKSTCPMSIKPPLTSDSGFSEQNIIEFSSDNDTEQPNSVKNVNKFLVLFL